MAYRDELRFLSRVLAKHHLQILTPDVNGRPDPRLDYNFRALFGREADYETGLYAAFRRAEENVIYRMTDELYCQYVFFRLPDTGGRTAAVIGPYLTEEPSREQLLEQAERGGMQPGQIRQVERHFGSIPVITDERWLFSLLEALGELMWGGGDAFRFETTEQRIEWEGLPGTPLRDGGEAEVSQWDIQFYEQRYAHEKELFRAVSMGQLPKVRMMMAGINGMMFEQRLSDSLRNLKNYCIVTNTLLRKAAESGGVHPYYLDRISSEYARKVEQVVTVEAAGELMNAMFEDYCQLVRRTAAQDYSPLVQRTVLYVDANPGSDLSLKALAAAQNVSASYLSAQFRKETGQTLTEHVNRTRVQYAERLLTDTRLQIQTIAQHCGMADVNYFSKLFKKYTGKTPRAYRTGEPD